jgi:hypothetical protein
MSLKTPLVNGLLQSDLDCAHFNLLNFTGGGGSITGSGVAGRPAVWSSASALFASTWPGKVVSVKDPPYNAAGNGTTDDSAVINQAIYDVVNAGGGTVFFPHGIYQCNGALSAYYFSVITLPFITATTTPTVCLRLVGENKPLWSVATANDETRNSCIRSATSGAAAGSSNYPAIVSASQPHAPGTIPYANMNNLFVEIRDMNFIATNSAMNGVRLDGVGWSVLENVGSYGVYNGGAEDTCGIWLPESQNFSINVANLLNVSGWRTGIRTGEHLRAPRAIQCSQCNVGVEFCDGIYPSQAYIQTINVADALKWSGQHPVDVLLENEHAIGSPPSWYAAAHEIKDPSNYGRGIVKYMIGQGGSMAPPIVAGKDGGTGLQMINLMALPPPILTAATGWTAPTGTDLRSGYATSTATLTQVAQTLKSLVTDLKTMGILAT